MKKLFTLLLSITMVVAANAADITAVQSGPWSDAATWGGSVPTAADNVNAGAFMITVSADAACKNYTIGAAAAGSLVLGEGVTLTVSGTIDAVAAIDVDLMAGSAPTSKLVLTGASVVTATPNYMITDNAAKSIRPQNLEVAVAADETRQFYIANTQSFTINVSAGKFTVKAPSNVFMGGRINIGKVDGLNAFTIESGATVQTRIIEGSFDGKKIPGAKVQIDGTLIATGASTIRNLFIGDNGVFKTQAGSIAVADQLTFDGWWNQTASATPSFLLVNEFSTPAFISTAASSTIEYNRTSNQNIQGIIPENKVWYIGNPSSFLQKVAGGDSVIASYNVPYANLKVSGSGTKTIQSNLVAKGTVTINAGSTLVLPAGKVMVVGGTVGGEGTFTNTGAVINLTSADVTKGTVTARVNAANEVTLVATPKTGFQLDNYTEGGSPLASATFTAADGAPRTIVANWKVATGLNDIKADMYVTVEGRNLKLHGDITAIEVYDAQGRRLLSQRNVTNVNVPSKGIYIVKLHTTQGVNTQKVSIK